MSLNSLDKQFIDDNMLTDEDFLYGEPIELSQADLQILDAITSQYQDLKTPATESASETGDGNAYSVDDLLQNFDIGQFNNFSDCSSYSSSATSPLSNTSVISIPDDIPSHNINGIGADTPPHTPSGSSDSGLESPSFTHSEPVIVTMGTIPQIAYVVPPNNQLPSVKPIKPPVTIKPKLVQSNTNSTFISNTNGSPVVKLNPEEALVKLPSGIYQVKSPKSNSKAQQKELSATKNNAKRKLTSDSELIELCEMALKRQTRIMKNRESASLSRKKKKEYVEKLEADLNHISAENSSLRNENNQLKLRITDLEKELTLLKAAFSSKAMKKTACFMVVLFIMSLNISPLSNIFDRTAVKSLKEEKNHGVGRVLLWNEESSGEQLNSSSNHFIKKSFLNEEDSSYLVSWERSYNSTCQQFINKSESIRLEKDLLGWVKRVEKKQKQKEFDVKTSVVDLKAAIPLPKLQLRAKVGHENRKDIWAKKKNRNEILIYQTPRKAYEDFFDAIHRRDDSFYFVSFSGDHLLLPAIAHNQTLRPRMSFVMPAMTLNESIDSDDYISMMQIDCEVIDTKLVHIKESVIPPHLRQKHNNTSHSSSKHKTKFSVPKNSKQLHDSTLNLSN